MALNLKRKNKSAHGQRPQKARKHEGGNVAIEVKEDDTGRNDVENGLEGEGGSEEESEEEGMEWEGISTEGTAHANGKNAPVTKGTNSNRPPTREELRAIKEASDLFKSSSFKLQIDALLPNVRPKASRILPLEAFLLVLHSHLMAMPSISPQHPLQAARALLKQGVVVPFSTPQPTEDTNWKVAFQKPDDVTIVGSWATKTGVKRKEEPAWTVDVALEMPSSLFQEKDYLDCRFFHKGAFYLAAVAAGLSSRKDLNVAYQYDSTSMDTRLTSLVLIPRSDGSSTDFSKLNARIRLLLTLPSPCPISLNHLSPSNCNLRIKSNGEKTISDSRKSIPTPLYNTALLKCTTPRPHLLQTHDLIQQVPGYRDALALLQIWANQRGFCSGSENRTCVFGFEGRAKLWSALLTILIIGEEDFGGRRKVGRSQVRTIGKGLSSYQLFRAVLDFLAKHDFCSSPILTKGGNRYGIEHYEDKQNPVFVDSASMNVLAGMPPSSLDVLRIDAKSTLDVLNSSSPSSDPFSELFLKERRHLTRFDLCIRVDLQAAKLRKPSLLTALDFGSLSYQLLHNLCGLLKSALTDRATAVTVLSPSVTTRPLSQGNVSGSLSYIDIGVYLNSSTAFRLVDHGPPAAEMDSAETIAFRELWGDKAELRRFKDGRIEESVVWDVKNTDERARIPSMIVDHILQLHLGVDCERDVRCQQSGYDELLRFPEGFTKALRGIAAQPGFKGAQTAFDNLVRALKTMDEDLPLSVLNVAPISSQLRYTSVFAPFPIPSSATLSVPISMRYLPPIDVVLQFERSSRWPDDLAAIQKTKLAFLETVGTGLMRKHPGLSASVVVREGEVVPEIADQVRLEVLTADGWAFSMRIWHDREATLLGRLTGKKPAVIAAAAQQQTAGEAAKEHKSALEALHRYQRRFIHAPRHHRAIATLSHRFPSYAGTVRLLKRWLASHWLYDSHVGDEAVELLCASIFLCYAKSTFAKDDEEVPPGTPCSKEVGFFRVIAFLKDWAWEEGLSVPLYDEAEAEDGEKRVPQVKARTGSGVWTISTGVDPEGHIWTSHGPDALAARRIKQLATATWSCLPSLEQGQILPKALFLHPTEDYDVLIHLEPSALRRYHQNVHFDASILTHHRKYINLPHDESKANGEEVVRVGFDPVAMFMTDLQRVYAGTLQFFYDAFGGMVIGCVWDPSIAESSRPFRVLSLYSSTPDTTMAMGPKGKGKDLVVLNKSAVLSEIQRLGEGLVKSIEIQRKVAS